MLIRCDTIITLFSSLLLANSRHRSPSVTFNSQSPSTATGPILSRSLVVGRRSTVVLRSRFYTEEERKGYFSHFPPHDSIRRVKPDKRAERPPGKRNRNRTNCNNNSRHKSTNTKTTNYQPTWTMRVVLSAFLVVATTAVVSCHAGSAPAPESPKTTTTGLLPSYFPFLSGGSTTAAQQQQSSGEEETSSSSLEVSIPLSQSSSLSKNDAPLMRDIEMLNDILNVIIQKEDMNTYQLVEDFLEYGRER